MSRTYHQRARILVVDNSEINREMLNDILGETYEIRLAGSGREALEILVSRVSRRPMNYLESRKATISWTASMMR